MLQPNLADPLGLRDRAILEVLYSTGLRRMEIIHLKLFDLQLDRGLLFVRQGKGKKDRYVPIGERAMAWLQKYIREARPQLALEPDDLTVFLTAEGEPFSRDHLTWTVRQHIEAAKLGKVGACHLLAALHGDAHARERSRHPPHPGDPRTRGHLDHANLHARGDLARCSRCTPTRIRRHAWSQRPRSRQRSNRTRWKNCSRLWTGKPTRIARRSERNIGSHGIVSTERNLTFLLTGFFGGPETRVLSCFLFCSGLQYRLSAGHIHNSG